MTQTSSALDWLPAELSPVALRLARADELQYELEKLCLEWSSRALGFAQVWNDEGLLDLTVSAIRPVPPAITTLFGEAVNHLRAAIDNVVFHLVEKARGSTLPPAQARKVEMPIRQSADSFAEWSKKIAKHVPELGPGTTLNQRIESAQPFADRTVIMSIPIGLAKMMGGTSHDGVHPLLLLQGYSNEDKHRMIRPVACRSIATRDDLPFIAQDLGWKEINEGDVVASDVEEGTLVGVTARTAVHIQRPERAEWVVPGAELSQIHDFIADILIPTLVAGAPNTETLPRQVDLSDSGETAEQRIRAGKSESAHRRANREIGEPLFADANLPRIIPMPD
ncbi:hypothetical protein K3U94_10650 [Mycolicibacter heraklionensis]|uniref:Uncharacterized protein n=1 Tax=Mycolicibacter heraklionensis TaxID=512402 RepID=A0A9X7ZJM1_9MYCO|nr:hypothetical protein [Mycolicibacter heraklionensis]QZA09633.1 hypothetical protein K3U94_10650 [Mycolicibacter heraklionensis]